MTCKVHELRWCAREGNDFNRSFRFTDDNQEPIDLSGYTISCQLRSRPNQQGRLLVDLIAEGLMHVQGADPTWLELTIPASVVDSFNFRISFGDLRLYYNGRTVTPFAFRLEKQSGTSVQDGGA